MTDDARRTIETIWKMESARLIARLTRIVRDVGLAEDLAQDALIAALEQWPESGVPQNPGAWLAAAARNRAVDHVRRDRMLLRKHEEIGRSLEEDQYRPRTDELDAALDDDIGDDLLRLIFMTCHPVLSTEARAALTLRLLGGLTTDEIARAFLTSEATIAQRIVRAKKTLTEKNVAIEAPRGQELVARLETVLQVLYLIFNEGYAATAGDDWTRPGLCEEAMRLVRILAGLAPTVAEVHGLQALMEIQASRLAARIGPSGEPVVLAEQNRAMWDHLLIRRGLAALELAESLAPARGPYVLQAAIGACHARAAAAEDTDWNRIADLYGELAKATPSPIIELNRAVAVSMARGPQEALDMLDGIADDPVLQDYHLHHAVRADLLEKLGRKTEAKLEFERAASLTRNIRERDLMLERARRCEA